MGDSVVDYAPSAAPTANGLPHQADDDSAYSHPLTKLVHRAVGGDVAGAQADVLALPPSILSQVGEICHASRLLRSARLYSLAEAMLQSAAATGESHWIARELAYVAHEAGDRELSHERFRAFLEKYPQSTIAHYDFIQSLTMNLRDNRLSEEFAASALSAFPDDLWVGQAYAICAENRADWDSALTRWARVCASHPAHEPAIDGITRCSLKRMSRADGANSGTISSSGVGAAVDALEYRVPNDLMATPTQLRRILVVGSCLIAGLADIITQHSPNCKVDYFGTNHAGSLPPEPPHPAGEYDFQVVQIALRSVLPDRAHMNLNYNHIEDYTQMFEETKERLSQVLQSIMQWNVSHGILTFVMNFLSPQQNLVGRLAPRYDFRNSIYFIDKLNMALADELLSYQNVYLFDTDQVVCTYGRRHYHDEILWVSSHGAALSDWDHQHDQSRLEATEPASKLYASNVSLISTAIWREMVGMYRTIQQVDSVKLVLIDLDDTLWRGVVGERDEVNIADREGWPLGFAEALRFLRRRGILLGIVSKNDESRALRHLSRIYGDVLAPEHFAIHRINWGPKIDNIQEILEELNLLPKNVIYIDDNPVERASVMAAFPEMRLLGGNPYLLRRILLWSPETQVATITAESSARTQMVQKQIERERQRKQMTRFEFLATLNIEASLFELTSIDHNHFSRAFELVNKTNQFNTTGKRWTTQEFIRLFANGGRLFAVEVSDRFTAYGLVAVCIFAADVIEQFVMSCRVIGLDVELAVVSALLTRFAGQAIKAELIETESNLACRDVWLRCGFIESNGSWTHLGGGLPAIPTHIQMNV